MGISQGRRNSVEKTTVEECDQENQLNVIIRQASHLDGSLHNTRENTSCLT